MSLIVDLLRKVEEERRNKESPKGSGTFLNIDIERPKRRFNYLHLGYILIGIFCIAALIVLFPVSKMVKKEKAINMTENKDKIAITAEAKGTPERVQIKTETVNTPVKDEVKKKEGTSKEGAFPRGKDEKTRRTMSASKIDDKRKGAEGPEEKQLIDKQAKGPPIENKDLKKTNPVDRTASSSKEKPTLVITKADDQRLAKMYSEAVNEDNRGNIEAAKTLYREILAERPDHIGALNNLGVLLMKEGKTKDALLCFKRVLERENNNPKAYNNIALILMMEGNKRLAEEYFRKAIELDKDGCEAYVNLSALLRSEARQVDALKLLEPVVKREDVDPSVYLSYAIINDEMGNKEDAIKYYRYYLRTAGKTEFKNKVVERLRLLEDSKFSANP